jgi:hypothetical protein
MSSAADVVDDIGRVSPLGSSIGGSASPWGIVEAVDKCRDEVEA